MSFWTAQHIGAVKIARLVTLLNDGATLAEVAKVLGVSVSRASRIVRKLFKRVYIPHEWTVDAVTFESNTKKYEALEVDRLCDESMIRAKEYAKRLKEVTG